MASKFMSCIFEKAFHYYFVARRWEHSFFPHNLLSNICYRMAFLCFTRKFYCLYLSIVNIHNFSLTSNRYNLRKIVMYIPCHMRFDHIGTGKKIFFIVFSFDDHFWYTTCMYNTGYYPTFGKTKLKFFSVPNQFVFQI